VAAVVNRVEHVHEGEMEVKCGTETGSSTATGAAVEEFLEMMTRKLLHRDPMDEIVMAFRMFVNDAEEEMPLLLPPPTSEKATQVWPPRGAERENPQQVARRSRIYAASASCARRVWPSEHRSVETLFSAREAVDWIEDFVKMEGGRARCVDVWATMDHKNLDLLSMAYFRLRDEGWLHEEWDQGCEWVWCESSLPRPSWAR